MNSKSAGIYSITSKVNGKRYIGSASRICERWSVHLSYLRANKHHSQHLQNHYNKYGEDDLVFNVLEVVERDGLNLSEFKEKLLSKEQTYLDSWNCCEFNCNPTAGSPLGLKRPEAKYYVYVTKTQLYMTYYSIFGKRLNFSWHTKEEDAITEVNYMKTLSDNELLEYKQKCEGKPRRRRRDGKRVEQRGAKNYSFYASRNKWVVHFRIDGKTKTIGYYASEELAINKVEELKKQYRK